MGDPDGLRASYRRVVRRAPVFGSDDVGNIFILASATLAGTPIVLKAARAAARVVGIEPLGTVATIGE